MICPRCDVVLIQDRNEYGSFWRCSRCDGRAVTMRVLRKTVIRDYIESLWLRTFHKRLSYKDRLRGWIESPWWSGKKREVKGCSCPACGVFMKEVSATSSVSTPILDICGMCKLVWFDPKEYEEVLSTGVPSKDDRELVLRYGVEIIRDMRRRGWNIESPDEEWKILPALFGIPVEFDAVTLRRRPWLSLTFAFVFILVVGFFIRHLDQLVQDFGLISNDLWRLSGLTWFTSLFIHGSLIQALINIYYFLYYFLNFGDNVEDELGRRRYLFLIFSCLIGGHLLEIVMHPGSANPLAGSGGVITGIIVFYILQFPYMRVGLVSIVKGLSWFRVPVYVVMISWLVIQLVGIGLQLGGFSNSSAYEHLGSALVGLLFWFVWRR